MHYVSSLRAQGSTKTHLTALSLLLLQFWKAAATAVALKRIIILPKFLCFCDELWMYALEDKEDVKCKYASGVLRSCLLATNAVVLQQTVPNNCALEALPGWCQVPLRHCGGCLWPAER